MSYKVVLVALLLYNIDALSTLTPVSSTQLTCAFCLACVLHTQRDLLVDFLYSASSAQKNGIMIEKEIQWDIVGIIMCSVFLMYQQREWVATELLGSENLTIDKIGVIITVVFWMHDQRTASQLKMRSDAGEVRAQAANMLALLERWVLLSDWLFEAVQPLTVAASAQLLTNQDVLSTRDFLWNETAGKIAEIVKCIVEEKLDTGHKVS
jgi:hypothetical protein